MVWDCPSGLGAVAGLVQVELVVAAPRRGVGVGEVVVAPVGVFEILVGLTVLALVRASFPSTMMPNM